MAGDFLGTVDSWDRNEYRPADSMVKFSCCNFMGVEYLLSFTLHKKIDAWLADSFLKRERSTSDSLRREMPFLRDRKMYRLVLYVFLIMAAMSGLIVAINFNIWPFGVLFQGWGRFVVVTSWVFIVLFL